MNYDDFNDTNFNKEREEIKSLNEHKSSNDSLRKKPYAWFKFLVFFLIITGIEILIFYPHVHKTIKESGVLSLIQNHKAMNAEKEKTTYQVYFFTINDTLERYKTTPIDGVDLNHGTFMALLAGPTQEAIEHLAFSYIPLATRLNGITIADRITYLDVSKEILTSPDFSKAFQQLQATAESLQQGNAFTLMVDGVPYKTKK